MNSASSLFDLATSFDTWVQQVLSEVDGLDAEDLSLLTTCTLLHLGPHEGVCRSSGVPTDSQELWIGVVTAALSCCDVPAEQPSTDGQPHG